jgi:hypothetical protein
MAQFVQQNIILQMRRQKGNIDVEVNIVFRRAASPFCPLAAKG